MVDVSARAPRRVAHRRPAGTPRAGVAGVDDFPGPSAVPPEEIADLDEWLTRPIPRIPGEPGVPVVLDPPTEQFSAVLVGEVLADEILVEEDPVDEISAEEAVFGGTAAEAILLEEEPTPDVVGLEQATRVVPSRRPVRLPSPRTRTAVRVAVLAVLLTLVGGSATAVAADKVVVLTVDGRDRSVHTFADDVAGALTSAGLAVTPQDRVEPAPTTELADGDHVILQRARPLTLVEGPSERRIWTTAASVDEALRSVGVDAQPIQMSTDPNTVIPLGGLAVELRVPRSVTVVDGSRGPEPVTSTAGTVAALLLERGVTLGVDDVSVPRGDTPVTEGMTVQVVRNGVGEVVEVRRIPPPEEIVEDPELPRGMRKVVEKGRPGEQTVVMRVHVSNGEEVRREQVRAGGTTPPEKRVVRVGTNDDLPPRADAPTVGPGVWDSLARCEAGGNWATNSGNGYYGGLQFDRQTWISYGGDQYAPLPHQADRDAQIAVASKVRDDRGGYGSWPACARKLGLPR